jgi:hypothetical protein
MRHQSFSMPPSPGRIGLRPVASGRVTTRATLCANMTETSCVTAISEQGGKENQYGNDERFCSGRYRCDASI